MQYRHAIKCNARTESPSYFIALAVAHIQHRAAKHSMKWVHTFKHVEGVRFRLEAGRVTREQHFHHEILEDFWEWYYEQLTTERPLWLWCDDLTRTASLLDLWKELDKGRLSHRCAVLTSRIGYISLLRDAQKSVWIDRRNWWRDPWPVTLSTENIYHELQSRVANLWTFLRKYDLGVLRVTCSGQSLQAYRHRFGPKVKEKHTPLTGINAGKTRLRMVVLPRVHNNELALGLERDALHGGPVHMWQLGHVKGPVHILDVNSLYPAVMKQNLYPTRLLRCQTMGNCHALHAIRDWQTAVADVTLITDKPWYPLRRKDVTIYPTGRFRTCLAGPELAFAHERGHIIRCHAIAWYELADLFSRYVDFFWSMKARSVWDVHGYWLPTVKIMLNSLHGKFCQGLSEWKEAPKILPAKRWGYWPNVLIDENKVQWCRSIAGKTQASQPKGWADHAFPAVAAFVYSYARLRMSKFFGVAELGKLYYSATDSIQCNQKAADTLKAAGLVEANKLGLLREVRTVPWVKYNGVHDYELPHERKLSGIPAGARHFANGEHHWLEHEQAGEVFERGPDGSLITRRLRVRQDRVFRYGKVHADGSVTPFQLQE
jgi:hypothetical protein